MTLLGLSPERINYVQVLDLLMLAIAFAALVLQVIDHLKNKK